MIDLAGRTVVFVGRLGLLPRRSAVRLVGDRGGSVRRSLVRATRFAVVGRNAFCGLDSDRLLARLATARRNGAVCVGERRFLRCLGLLPPVSCEGRTLTLDDLMRASALDAGTVDLLDLFDILDGEDHRYPFSSLATVRAAARLIGEGVPLAAVCESLLAVASMQRRAAADLVKRADGKVGLRWGGDVADLSGQLNLPLPESPSLSADELFEAAERAEDAGDLIRAESLYRRCVDIERSDPCAAFNLANVLRTCDRNAEARLYFCLATTIDPGFAEAWYNLAHLLDASGCKADARKAYQRALDADPQYGDALFNAALLDFECERYREAEALWERYLAIDPVGDWARRARSGMALCRTAARPAS